MATVSVDGQSSMTDGIDDSLAMPMPVGGSGDGTFRLGFPSSLFASDKGSDGRDDKLNSHDPSTCKDPSENPLYVETTVEVCVKLVVCRKYFINTIDSKTGRITSSNVRTEEDPPTILNVHTYKTPTDSSASALAGSRHSSTHFEAPPAPSIKRRPGRPRKCPPPPLTPSRLVKRSDPVEQSESAEKLAEEAASASVERGSKPDTNVAASGEVATPDVHAEHTMLPSPHQQGLGGVPKRSKNKFTSFSPIKRRAGRPSRVIKKPRKYLDDDDEEPFIFQRIGASEDSNKEEEDSDEEMEGVAEMKEEEGRGEGKQGEEGGGENGEATEQGEDGTEQKLECPKCGKKFSNPSNCQRHISNDQCNSQRQCTFCGKLFDNRAVLEEHMDTHRDQESHNNYRCNDCNRTYATRNGYLKHKRQGTCYKRDVFHEDGTQGEFECPQCRVRFTTEKLLELHKEKVHENPNSEYKCPDCNRVFYSKLGFNKHIAKKSCTQPHECKVCGKKYSNKAKESFKSHMRYHLAETSGVQFQCEDCGRVYMTDMALKKHRLTSHSGLRPYKCSTCSKTFPMRYMVRDHERSHTGEKPFLCNLCGTSFSNRGHLYRHMRSHTLGTLHKRGRPRKYPAVSRPVLLKIKDQAEEGQEMFDAPAQKEEASGGLVEIKSDPLQQDLVQEDLASMGAGPTYITVHTIDGQLGEAGTTQNLIGEGQLQHVVMETPDGMSDNMVLQVIRDLTGATTVYQHITEQPIGAAPPSSETVQAPPSQIIMSTVPQQGVGHQTLVVEPGSSDGLGQSMVAGGQEAMQNEVQQHQLIVTPAQSVAHTLS